MLHDFAEAGILERREHGRKRVSQRTSAQWQLRSGTTDVRIIDYSQGGYCLCSQVEGQLGERTILQLESGEERTIRVPGEIKWQVESQDGFVIGCQFLDAQDFSVLCELLEPIPKVGSHHSKLHSLLRRSRLSRRSPRVIVACVVALLCIAVF